jgi:hypothetical protein
MATNTKTYKTRARHWFVLRDQISSAAKDEPTRAVAVGRFQAEVAALGIEANGLEDRALTARVGDDGSVAVSLGATMEAPTPPAPAPVTQSELEQRQRMQAERDADPASRLARLETQVAALRAQLDGKA